MPAATITMASASSVPTTTASTSNTSTSTSTTGTAGTDVDRAIAVPSDSNAHSSLKRARILFGSTSCGIQQVESTAADTNASTSTSTNESSSISSIHRASVARRRRLNKNKQAVVATTTTIPQAKSQQQAIVVSTVTGDEHDGGTKTAGSGITGALISLPSAKKTKATADEAGGGKVGGILVHSSSSSKSSIHIPTPTWHAPWKLSTVLSSHLGWVRSIAVDPTSNRLFATGGADRTIKIWNLAAASVGDSSNALQLTLTGHISPVRGLAFSPRHPYLFSCGEDKQVKCWDLETNQVVRHYHGHLSGVYCLKLHPTLDLLVTGGRDAVARVWDMRTKTQLHCLSGHDNTVGCLLVNSTHPSVITGSQDSTVKMWDLASGRCVTTLTHHQKGVRALVQSSFERTMCTGAADGLKKFTSTKGQFLTTMTGHRTVINALAVNEDGVLVSGGDDGSLRFWDYTSGYAFQDSQSQVQPGSLEAENGVMALEFDLTGTRLITGECDKTIKIYRPDDDASEISHPIDMAGWRKKCLAQAKQRY